jgi:hypothetical protein
MTPPGQQGSPSLEPPKVQRTVSEPLATLAKAKGNGTPPLAPTVFRATQEQEQKLSRSLLFWPLSPSNPLCP